MRVEKGEWGSLTANAEFRERKQTTIVQSETRTEMERVGIEEKRDSRSDKEIAMRAVRTP